MRFKNIAILGGTHGNEWSGVKVVNEYVPELISKNQYTFKLHPVEVNSLAVEQTKRYVDFDMNRISAHLHDETFSENYEWRRAKEIVQSFNDKEIDFIIDMHTTTSNMGMTLIITELDPVLVNLCIAVQLIIPSVKILLAPDTSRKYLVSQRKHGIMIEVGACQQGILDAKIIQQTILCLDTILSSLEKSSQMPDSSMVLEYYKEKADFYYPDNFMIHPKFQGRDFQLLSENEEIFIDIFGNEIFSTHQHQGYAIFINEAAYYKTNLAFSICEKKRYQFNGDV